MTILFRFIWMLLTVKFRAKIGFFDVAELKQRVWPIDLDTNIHMNNSRYLAVMDLGRIDWVIRCGGAGLMAREKYAPVVGGSMLRFRRSLLPFQRYVLKTRVLGWDDRWAYFEQTLHAKQGVACYGVLRAGFTKEGKLVPPSAIAGRLGYDGPDVPAPEWAKGWNEEEKTFVQQADAYYGIA